MILQQTIIDTIAKFNNGTGMTEVYYFETLEKSNNFEFWTLLVAFGALIATIIFNIVSLRRNERVIRLSNTPEVFIIAKNAFEYYITNNGTGNARSIRIQYIYNNKLFDTINEVFKYVSEETGEHFYIYPNQGDSPYINGVSLRPSQTMNILRVVPQEGDNDIKVKEILKSMLYRVSNIDIFRKPYSEDYVCPFTE